MTSKIDDSGRDRFLTSLAKSPLQALLSPYEAEARLRAAFRLKGGLYAGAEVLIAASAQTKSGPGRRIPPEEAIRIRVAADRFVVENISGPSNTVSGLRTVRALRPPWFSCPIYEAILSPFGDQLERLVGHRPEALLRIANEIYEQPPSAGGFPDRWAPLATHLTISHDDIGSPADLWKAGFVLVGTTTIPLKYKIADVTYRWVCETLAAGQPKFLDQKGRRLEQVLLTNLRIAFPHWEWVHSYKIVRSDEGRVQLAGDNEKDFLGYEGSVGVAIESKSLRFRPSSGYWSALNAESDSGPITEAGQQLLPALRLLESGGRVNHSGSEIKIPKMTEVFGLIVTDEVFTPFVWDRDFEAKLRSGRGESSGGTWESGPTRLSIIDFALLHRLADGPAVLLDFLSWYRSSARLALVDIPEAWLLYGSDPIVKLVEKGEPIVSEEPEWWNLARSMGFEGLRPPWIYRKERVDALCNQHQTHRALRVVRADRISARNRFPNAIHRRNMPRLWREYPQLLDARLYKKTSTWELLRTTPPVEESPRLKDVS